MSHSICKLREKEEAGEGATGAGAMDTGNETEDITSNLDPKVVEVYTSVGKYLHTYKSGKIPKAFKIIPSLRYI